MRPTRVFSPTLARVRRSIAITLLLAAFASSGLAQSGPDLSDFDRDSLKELLDELAEALIGRWRTPFGDKIGSLYYTHATFHLSGNTLTLKTRRVTHQTEPGLYQCAMYGVIEDDQIFDLRDVVTTRRNPPMPHESARILLVDLRSKSGISKQRAWGYAKNSSNGRCWEWTKSRDQTTAIDQVGIPFTIGKYKGDEDEVHDLLRAAILQLSALAKSGR